MDSVQRANPRRDKIKVLIAMSVAVILASFGDIMLGFGVKAIDREHQDVWSVFVASLTDPYIIGGVLLLICFFFLYLTSLSWAELSYVLPLTAAEYAIVTLLAYFILGEQVLGARWAGSLLVAAGIALVTRS